MARWPRCSKSVLNAHEAAACLTGIAAPSRHQLILTLALLGGSVHISADLSA